MDHEAPLSPTYPDQKRQEPGVLLFKAVEHFMSWIITQNRKLDDCRSILRGLELILRICEVSQKNGRMINALEEKNALGVLYNLTTGLESGEETWSDILPAIELMIFHLENTNPKSLAIAQTVQLIFDFHDKTDASEELSKLVKEVVDVVTSHMTPTLPRETAEKITQLVKNHLQKEKWQAQDLIDLENQLEDQFKAA